MVLGTFILLWLLFLKHSMAPNVSKAVSDESYGMVDRIPDSQAIMQ
jgi:hypothetical protein